MLDRLPLADAAVVGAQSRHSPDAVGNDLPTSLAPGHRIGVYEVMEPVGEGAMGQVYRARDTKLNRDVALKVLPGLFALDADRLARFKREAQMLAALNHPNIAATSRAVLCPHRDTRALLNPCLRGSSQKK